jgi:ABC-type glycerol-3-phosphate transport system permease component
MGLGVLLLLGTGVILLATEITSGILAYIVGVLMAVALVGYVASLVRGTPEARRSVAPYALLKPGVLWLSIFFLAPLWALFVMSLSSKESRFDFFPSFTWEWENYQEAFTRFRPQFVRSFTFHVSHTNEPPQFSYSHGGV